MMSDDSENDGIFVDRIHENNVYFKKYKLLLEECEAIQKHNERLVYRIDEVKRITKRRMDQVAYIKQKLKFKYSEDWTEIPCSAYESMNAGTSAKQPKGKGAKESKGATNNKQKLKAPQPVDEKQSKAKKPAKRKIPRAEKDPRAPKRPSNPFFQFCQEQRQPLMEQLVAELKPGQVEPNKQELTRQLALKWKTLSAFQKQVYVDMYERSKEKYAAEMTEYNLKR